MAPMLKSDNGDDCEDVEIVFAAEPLLVHFIERFSASMA